MKFLQQMFLSIFTISLCMTPRTSYALSEKAAAYISICGGVAIGAAAGKVSQVTTKRPLYTALVSLVAGGISWGVLRLYLSTLTPKSKINAAIKIIQIVESDSLLKQNFTTMEVFVKYINARFGTNCSVYDQIRKIRDDCEEILSLIQQVANDSEDSNMIDTAEKLMEKTHTFIQTMNITETWARLRDIEVGFHKIETAPILLYDSIMVQDTRNNRNSPDGAGFPLVIAYNNAITLKNTLEDHLQTIDHILYETSTNDSPGVTTTCKELKARGLLLLNTLVNKINLLSTHEDYKFQVLLYKKSEHDEELKKLNENLIMLKGEVTNLHSLVDQQKRQIENIQTQSHFNQNAGIGNSTYRYCPA
jgi:hypothetical protein